MTPKDTLESRVNATRTTFLLVEIELAETYCNIAAKATAGDRYERNVLNAQNAFDGAFRFMNLVRMTNRETESFLNKLSQVRSMLDMLNRTDSVPAPFLLW